MVKRMVVSLKTLKRTTFMEEYVLWENFPGFLTDLSQFIRAVDRGELNKALLDELEAMPNVKFFFNHKLVGADFRKNPAWFERRDSKDKSKSQSSTTEVEVSFDLMIGAD